ncbi:RHS repeat-associated core domain-containing protein, partial [Flavobacterium macrobrachii]
KYRYQSQEFQDELGLNIYFFKFRMSDPAIGRFLQIDPLSPTYAYNSTYAFAENNVTSGIDIEGLELSFHLDGSRATAQSGPRVTGGVNGNYTLQELRSEMSKRQAEYDRAMGIVMSSDPRSLPKSDIHLPSSDIRVARHNDPGMMMADGVRIGAEFMATDVVLGKVAKGISALSKGESVWSLNSLQRGRMIEELLGANSSWARNFPTIDKIENGVATSIKSMDLTASSYQKGNSVFNTLKGYIDDLASFTNTTWGNTTVTQGKDYTSKALELAVQTGKGSESQWSQIQQAINYALDNDISIVLRFIE